MWHLGCRPLQGLIRARQGLGNTFDAMPIEVSPLWANARRCEPKFARLSRIWGMLSVMSFPMPIAIYRLRQTAADLHQTKFGSVSTELVPNCANFAGFAQIGASGNPCLLRHVCMLFVSDRNAPMSFCVCGVGIHDLGWLLPPVGLHSCVQSGRDSSHRRTGSFWARAAPEVAAIQRVSAILVVSAIPFVGKITWVAASA